MAIDRILQLKLITDVSQTTKAVTGVKGRLRGAASEIGSWTKALGLGVVIGGIEQLGTALSQGVTDFNEGTKAAERLGRTWTKLGLNGDELSGTIDEISNRAVGLGFDDTESVDVFNRFLNKTRDAKKSTELLAAAQDLARAKGISLSEAAGIVGKAYDGNKKTLREFGVEGVTGMEAVNAIMQTSKGAAEEYADTLSGKLEIVQGVIGEGFETAAGIGIQALTDALPTISDWAGKIGGLWDQVQPALQQLADMLGPKIGDAIGKLGQLWDELAPHVTNAIDIIQPIIQSFGDTAAGIFDAINGALDAIISLLQGDFEGAWQGVQDVIGGITDAVQAQVDGAVGVLQNIIPTIATAAADVASSIFDGIVNGLAGLGRAVTDAVVGGIRAGLNALIGIWNDLELPGFTIHIPAISIPNPAHGTVLDPIGKPFFDIMGASDFQLWGRLALPNIPRLAEGGIVRGGHGGTLAMIGEGAHDEAVIPLDGRLGPTYIINVNAPVAADPASVGRAIVGAIQAFEVRGGTGWRAA